MKMTAETIEQAKQMREDGMACAGNGRNRHIVVTLTLGRNNG